jgi:hypothetical protein
VKWIRLAQDRDRWRAVMKAVMNLRFLAPRSQLVLKYFSSITYVECVCGRPYCIIMVNSHFSAILFTACILF